MKDKKKLLQKIISGSRNVRFREAVRLAEAFGFRLDRISGCHHIFVHPEIPELLNLQNVAGQAKPYQMKQLIKIVEKHNLRMETSE
jgi:predicted RNA binding protein YcfA (HicA-like mRNA interferase family)